ncbi:MAG TPA: PHP domain-containing protein [Elusimicrobia bacterium]|nr:MAG: PHP domain-containing protein [Elusimicrobia bacterium RIFOXYA12_FULL_49_49]OGS10065.1 MAG: PHP domain-containing protein [Elusimicrobia bacterium RIFOXYA1_FULL_47_7]OGS15294.1 MAG: PHP domain-containing protein [Elusimicrobia bacterium RIFOXYA2_FULL_47_53]OGS26552.1 MAG: PHP domain-containing protein [Elusimicrobia bacterium RIFOXYB12_FULL_50_12]OGS30549.1 MAG: PHP domain-containing protein [Elusimicrobia bacterium RIFOXYB2_FULL_46_23]HBU68969.1 PHP domain-containing protein [Elusimic
MIDLHTHSFFSDGVLIPSELVYRAKVKGYSCLALTDHGDFSNFDFIIPRIRRVAAELSKNYNIIVLPGIEITYVPPKLIKKAVARCRALGAKVVVVHGETTAETVPPGTNRSAALSGADILAHPGLISAQDALLAKKNNVCLEITTRRGHNKTNKHVAARAKECGAKLVLNTDSHSPDDLLDAGKIKKILSVSGLKSADFSEMRRNSENIIRKATRRK